MLTILLILNSQEKRYGQVQTFPEGADLHLVAESRALSETVIAQAHAQLDAAGYVTTEFAQSTFEDATARARDAVQRSAQMLPPNATSADILRASTGMVQPM